MSRHSAEVLEFKKRVDQGRRPKSGKTFSKNHKWRNVGKKGEPLLEHYMLILNIPEAMSEFYNGKSVPAPRYGRLHSFVRAFGDLAKRDGVLNLFPNSTVGDIRCTGDETCLVCQRIAEEKEKLGITGNGKDLDIPDDLNKNQLSIAKSLTQNVDGYGKGKKKVVFAGIEFLRDTENQGQWKMSFDRYVMSEHYWKNDFMPVLSDSRNEDEDEWKYEEHANDEFTLDGVTKPLCEFSKDEQKVIFLENTENKYPIVWDMVDACMLKYVEDGTIDDRKSVMTVKKNYPYFPPQYVDETTGEEKKKLTKLKKKAEGLYNWIIENIATLPDIDSYFPAEITADEQRKLLGIDKESTDNKMEDVSDKTASKAKAKVKPETIKEDFFNEDEDDSDDMIIESAPQLEEDDDDDIFDGNDDGFDATDDDFDIEEPI